MTTNNCCPSCVHLDYSEHDSIIANCEPKRTCRNPLCDCHVLIIEKGEWEERFDDQFIDLQEHDGLAYKQIKDFIRTHFLEKDRVAAAIEEMTLSGKEMPGFTGEVSTTRIEGYNAALTDLKQKL